MEEENFRTDPSPLSVEEVDMQVVSQSPSSSAVSKAARKKSGSRQSKGRNPKRRRKVLDQDEAESLLLGMSQDIDDVLEETAQKNNLTAINVKNILRHVITNQDVLAMVWNTMRLEEGGDVTPGSEISTVYEQKLTRSKVRKLCATECTLAVRTSGVDDNPTKKLLEEEFPENESSDEEYSPASVVVDGDDESDEEARTPKSSRKLSVLSSLEKSPTPLPFEELSEDSSLQIAEEEPMTSEDEDKIALRTRSKLPLTDTLIESIEAAFVAPDITTDMYDSECDDEDWRSFLGDFLKPSATNSIDVEDDDQEDPEYNFLEDEDVTDTWDLRNDKAVKVSKKELNDLVAELIEATDQDCISPEEDEEPEVLPAGSVSVLGEKSRLEEQPSTSVSHLITGETRAILEEQMRMHVQLLAQTSVMCIMDGSYQEFRRSSQTLLLELKHFAEISVPGGQKSAFAAANLSEAVHLVMTHAHVEPVASSPAKMLPGTLKSKKLKYSLKEVPKYAQSLIATSRAFIYPDLIPLHAFLPFQERPKVTFLASEDHLLALGLEQFEKRKDQEHIKFIHTYMLPAKTEQQIRVHIKNVKRAKLSEDNPLKYFFKHNKAPPVTCKVVPFDPTKMVAPQNRSFEQVPPWLRKYVRYSSKPPYVNISPAQPAKKPQLAKTTLNISAVPTKPPIAPLTNFIIPPLPKSRFNPILPRLNTSSSRLNSKGVSPLKQISPLLKKYVYHGSRGPLRLSFSPTKKPSSSCTQNRPLAPKALPTSSSRTQNRPLAPKALLTPSSRTRNRPLAPKALPTPDTDIVARAISISALPLMEEEIAGEPKLPVSAPTISSVTLEKDQIQAAESLLHPGVERCAQKAAPSGVTVEEAGEDLDNEGDLEALMLSSSTICKRQHSLVKKKNKQQRDLEKGLALLAPDILGSDPLRDVRLTHFARSYIERVRESLSNDVDKFGRFLQTLSEFESSNKTVVQLFSDMSHVLSGHPSLVDDFACFLTPEQAHECGKFKEREEFSRFQTFLRKMEIYQPHQLSKFLRVLTQLQKDANLSMDSVHSAVQPFLRNQSHLIEEFSRLFLNEAPPESLMTEFEEVNIPDSDADANTEDEEEGIVEEFVLPETEDLCGTKKCPCKCHVETTDPRMLSRNRHCTKCGIRFVDGRIFLQRGKGLKPAQVIYSSESEESGDEKKKKKQPPPPSSSRASERSNKKAEKKVEEKASSKSTSSARSSATCTDAALIPNAGRTLATCSNLCGIESLKVALPSTSSDIFLHMEEEGGVEIYDPFALAVQQVMSEEGSAKEAVAQQYGLSFSNPCREPWTKAEDKVLLETCQKYGATDRAFTQVTAMLDGRMLEDVKHRFLELMTLFTVHSNLEDAVDSD